MSFGLRTKLCMGLLCSAVVWLGGCQQSVKIAWDPPANLPVATHTPLRVETLCKDCRDPQLHQEHPTGEIIGMHTWSLFALPGGTMNADPETPLMPSFNKALRETVQSAGYDLQESSASAQSDKPVLRGELHSCWWWSYAYTWPANIEGGEIKVVLFLQKPDGTVLWTKTFKRNQPGVGVGGSYGFEIMVKAAMTNLLKDVQDAVSAEDFKKAAGSNI